MAKWYDPWLTSQEKKNLQVGQKGIRARQRQQEEARETRGYPKSGDRYQKQAAANNYSNSAANRGYPQSGDSAQKQAAQNAPKTRNYMKSNQNESNRVSGGGMMKAAKSAQNVNALRKKGYSAKEAVRKTNRNALYEAFSEANSLSDLKNKIRKK